MPETQETKTCPFCAESILAAAKKCKHCGEFLEEGPRPPTTSAEAWQQPSPGVGWKRDRSGFWRCVQHSQTDCTTCTKDKPPVTGSGAPTTSRPTQPVWRWNGFVWKCIQHNKWTCQICASKISQPNRSPGLTGPKEFPAPGGYEGKSGFREKLSQAGERTPEGELKCPRCGSTNFTAKRSATGKVLAGILAPKTQVKCVACGLMFKRG